MKKMWSFLIVCCVVLVCHAEVARAAERDCYADGDSLFGVGYNFVVDCDSLPLFTEIPALAQALVDMPDTICVGRDDVLVVAEFMVIPTDSVDSVWVKVARDQLTQGWVHRSQLLDSAVPDDPISQCMRLFRATHQWCMLALLVLTLLVVVWQRLARHRIRALGVKDISSIYPVLLSMVWAGCALLYGCIMNWMPERWEFFYFHPTLNPFAVVGMLRVFLFASWVTLLLVLALLFEVFRQLSVLDAIAYLFSLFCVQGVLYLFFSEVAMYYALPAVIVYVLLVAVLLWYYITKGRPRYRCGRCGASLHTLGRCPRCGVVNE